MFLLWEHTVLSLFNYIVFVWLFLLVVLRLPLPDRPARLTLNMAGFKVRRETRTAAPDWLDAVQARVTRDAHSSPRVRPGPALPPPCSHIGASPRTTTALQTTSTAHSSLPCEILQGTAQPWAPGCPISIALITPTPAHISTVPIEPVSITPITSVLSPSQTALPHTCSAHLQAAPRGQRAFFPLATLLSSSSALLVILKAFQRMLSGLDVVWLGCLFSYWRFYDRIGNKP